jgi:hypothetical protein
MFLFWHATLTLIVAGSIALSLSLNPFFSFIMVTVFAGIMPDLDHLLCWNPSFLGSIFPTRWIGEGLVGWMEHDPGFPLHLWIWPILLSLTLGAVVKFYPSHTLVAELLFAATVGWISHLALDGVKFIV